MTAYILSLMVTLDQECAIQQLFTHNRWQFTKLNIVDQTVNDTLCDVSVKLVGTNEESDQTADDLKPTAASSVCQLNDSRFIDKFNTNDDEHEVCGNIDLIEATSEQTLCAIGITVTEETLHEDELEDNDDDINFDSDMLADDVETNSSKKVKKVTTKRKNNVSAKIAGDKKRKGTCMTDEVLASEIEPSIRSEREDGSSNNEDEILAVHEEMPDVKHISELLPSEYQNIRSPLRAPSDLDTNCYSSSLSIYFCKWCGYTFPELKYLNGHKQNGQCFFTCQFCEEKFTFKNFSKYQDHLKEHRKPTVPNFQCQTQVASVVNQISRNAAAHENMADISPASTPKSRKRDDNRTELSRSPRQHTRQLIHISRSDLLNKISDSGNISCDVQRQEVKNVFLKHKLFTCDRCPGSTFLTSGTLRCHIVREHGTAFKCQLCGRKFGLSRHLKEHMMTHQSSRDFVCSKCGVAVKYKKSLVRHVQSCDGRPKMKGRPKKEAGGLKYPCPECKKTFTTRRLIQQHMYTHGQSDKPCYKCGTSFKHYSALSRHVQNCPC